MTRGVAGAAVALLIAAAGPAPTAAPAPAAAAADKPLAQPSRDAVIGYHLAPAAGEAIDVRVLLQAGGRAMRLDLPDTSFMLAKPDVKELTLVVPLERTALELPWADGPQPLFLVDDSKKYARKGDAMIAGQRCGLWDAVADKSRTSVCVTVDGVILRQISFDAVGRRNLVEAFAIRYDPLPPEAFVLPPGFERMVGSSQ